MAHSNSSLSCYADCPYKYKLRYIDNVEPEFESVHLQFGTMAHDVLHKAGDLRDRYNDGVLDMESYNPVIPSEVLYDNLKSHFSISSWNGYFRPIIKQIAEYEEELKKEIEHPVIHREIKLQATSYNLMNDFGYHIGMPLVGVIDFLMVDSLRKNAIILDYKFSTKRKTQDDFDLNSQLYIYAYLVHITCGVPLRNIQVGYIDIPKQSFSKPTILTNGTLSRAKSQNTSGEIYAKCVLTIHGDDPYYNCDPGGYYYDIYHELLNNKSAYLQKQYLDTEIYEHVIKDMIDIAYTTEVLNKIYIKKCDSYSCSKCEYLKHCKPWLYVGFKE